MSRNPDFDAVMIKKTELEKLEAEIERLKEVTTRLHGEKRSQKAEIERLRALLEAKTTPCYELLATAIERQETQIGILQRRLEAAHEHVEAADREVSYITGLQGERDEWRQAAQVEAGLRREFQAEIERLLETIKMQTRAQYANCAEIERLREALQAITDLPKTNPADPFLADKMDRIARAALEPKP